MPEKWQQKYSELTVFIAGHPEVNIKKSIVQIPGDTRPEFYRLFDAIRTTFITEMFPDLISNSQTLIKHYAQAEKEVIKLLTLESITTPPSIRNFLQSSTEELIRGLFYTLFDLIQGKVDSVGFEKKASIDIKASFKNLSQSVYEKWINLSLMKMLHADKLFEVSLPKYSSAYLWKAGGIAVDNVPIPQEASSLRFNEYSLENRFTVPDAIFHSATLNRYVSFRSELGGALMTASNASEKRDWYPIDGVLAPMSGLILIYLADKPEEISLIADAKRICRPDLIIECTKQIDRYEKEGLEKIWYHHNNLKPKLGTYILSQEQLPKDGQEEMWEGIHIVSVGFKQSRLENIINAMSNSEKKVCI
jgi:hypothetical protein